MRVVTRASGCVILTACGVFAQEADISGSVAFQRRNGFAAVLEAQPVPIQPGGFGGSSVACPDGTTAYAVGARSDESQLTLGQLEYNRISGSGH